MLYVARAEEALPEEKANSTTKSLTFQRRPKKDQERRHVKERDLQMTRFVLLESTVLRKMRGIVDSSLVVFRMP